MEYNDTALSIAGKSFHSRLLVGTGKYRDLNEAETCIDASGAEIVTVALRRVDLSSNRPPMLQSKIDPERYTYLPNSAGCYTADEAIRTFSLARQINGWNLIKLEVIGDKVTLYPDMLETLKAARVLVDDGFDVMVYCNDDPLIAKELEAIGCVAIMPLAAPIGSGLGLLNPHRISTIIEQSNVPVIVDAGLGTASDVAKAMELGCDGVLLNSAIAHAQHPLLMARAMRDGVKAGRQAFLAGRMPIKQHAVASSPLEGMSVSKKKA